VTRPKRFAFISSNFTWGGSEELWSLVAAALAHRGHRVTAYKNTFTRHEGNVELLREANVRLVELARFPLLPTRLFSAIFWLAQPLSLVLQAFRLHLFLRFGRRPDLVVISQGGNHDGWLLASACRRLHHPYVVISQKATDLYWPRDNWIKSVRGIYEGALHAFFVSEHNHRLTEEQIGRRIEAASVVRNPFQVPWEPRSDWPSEEQGFRLACVGRLDPREKGQDLLLRVMAMDKWRSRPVTVTFYGHGEQRLALEAMAALHGLNNVEFAGYADDVAGIWSNHHGLVLPSRAEGLPLVLVEAMLSGRVAIVTDVAGNTEVLEDNVTGFVVSAPCETALDEAMERAWQRRHEWQGIGEAAAKHIRKIVPADPARVLSEELLRVAEASLEARGSGNQVGNSL
jgi:glycosyltransferase involved in cell wall biosynthesis